MRTYDFTPLYRSAVGFDRLANLLETAARTSQDSGYPPYNIETTGENAYRIEIAVAGFAPDELNIEVKENLLTVTGRKTANDDAEAQKALSIARLQCGGGEARLFSALKKQGLDEVAQLLWQWTHEAPGTATEAAEPEALD